MADLFDRFTATDASKIHVHAFHAALADYLFAGGITKAEIVDAWALDTQASANLDAVIAKIDAQATVQNKLRVMESFGALLILLEEGIRYNTRATFIARFNAIAA